MSTVLVQRLVFLRYFSVLSRCSAESTEKWHQLPPGGLARSHQLFSAFCSPCVFLHLLALHGEVTNSSLPPAPDYHSNDSKLNFPLWSTHARVLKSISFCSFYTRIKSPERLLCNCCEGGPASPCGTAAHGHLSFARVV